MPEKWTGDLIGKMHNERVTAADIAAELGCTKAFISMILHGSRAPDGAQEKLEGAFQRILERRSEMSS